MPETVLNQEEQKTHSTHKSEENRNRIYRILVVVLSLIMIGLTVYIKIQQDNNHQLLLSNEESLQSVKGMSENYRSYVKQYKDTKVQLEETTKKLEAVTTQLNDVSAQLETTKGLLAQTQTMLSEAQAENAKLKEGLSALDGLKSDEKVQNITELEARINALKNKNSQAETELGSLKNQLKAFQADFSTINEGRTLISLFQNKIRLVKSRIRYLEQEAYFAKIAAQKEKDRIAILNGNNGFLTQNGVLNKKANKGFSIDVKMVQ